jgi:hypothetical protein
VDFVSEFFAEGVIVKTTWFLERIEQSKVIGVVFFILLMGRKYIDFCLSVLYLPNFFFKCDFFYKNKTLKPF